MSTGSRLGFASVLLALASCASHHGKDDAGTGSGDMHVVTDFAGDDLYGVDLASANDLSEVVLHADLYVSPNGSDTNDGSAATTAGGHGPLATLDKARQLLQGASFGKGTKPLLVYLEDGSLDGGAKPYYGTAVAFVATDSGAAGNVVTYAAYPGHTPVLSGGTRLTGWSDGGACGTGCEKWTHTIASATYTYFESLFYNGARRFRPRLGATAANLAGTYYRFQTGSQTGAQSSFIYATADPISSTWANLGGAYPAGDVVVYDFEDWSVDICRIQSINATTPGGGLGTVTCTGATPAGTAHGFFVGHRYLVENAKDLLLYPGQWFLDRSTSPWVLTYYASATEKPNTDLVEVPQQAQVLTATGLSYVTFSGLTFEHDNFTVPATGYQSVQQEPTVPAAVHASACAHVRFDTDVFTHTSGVGLDVIGASQAVSITHGVAADTGSHGFRIGQIPSTATAEAALPSGITLTDNAAFGVGRVIAGSFGVAVGLVNASEIGWNSVSDAYNSGISICMPNQGGVCGGVNNEGLHDMNVHDNDVWDIGQGVTSDMGGIYLCNPLCTVATGGTCTTIQGGGANNVITHNSIAYVTDASVYDSDGYGGQGIYLDQNSARVSVSLNRVHAVSAVALNMTRASTANGQPHVWNNNLAADGLQALIGVSGCPPVIPDQQFQATHNLLFSRLASATGFYVQKLGATYYGTAAPTVMQLFANNEYFDQNWDWQTTGTPFTYDSTWATGDALDGTCTGLTHIGWTAWTTAIPGATGGEDSGSVFQNPGFKKPYCTDHSAQACHDDATMDDYSAAATPGKTPVPPGGAAITLSGFGRRSGPSIPASITMFPTSPLDPSAFCSGTTCP